MEKIIEVIKYIILGAIQGFSEILPISSSAHLIISKNILNIAGQDLTLEMFLHLGSAIAVIIFYHKKLISIIKSSYRYFIYKDIACVKESDLAICLLIATIPAAIIGFIFEDIISSIFTQTIFIACGLLITTFLILLISKATGKKEHITYKNALFIGLFQALGIIPGVSRSAITLTGASNEKLQPAIAGDFVFLLFIPIALGSGALSLIKLINNPINNLIPVLIAFLVTILTTMISLKIFLNLIKKRKIRPIAYYTLTLAIILFLSQII